MKVTAWNNGSPKKSGSGYGLKITSKDRDSFFCKEWTSVHLILPNKSEPVEINIDKKSFWSNTCRELISKEIGLWLCAEGHAPWMRGKPPKFELIHTGSNIFEIKT